MKETGRMLVSTAAAAGIFIVLFMLMRWNIIICAALCVGVYFGMFLLLKPVRRIAGIDIGDMPDGEEIQKLIDEAGKDMADIDVAAAGINDSKVRSEAERLYGTGKRIMGYLNENPGKIKTARRFFTYYLDTAAKLLTRYVDFQDTGLDSDEVADILKKTGEALPILNDAFEKQFTHLMQGELMDVEADIDLLNSTLKMEGGK